MFARISHTQLLRYAGLFTWAMVGLPLLYVWLSPISAGELSLEDATAAPIAFGWLLAAYLIFGFSYAWVTRRLGRRLPRWDDNALLLVDAEGSKGLARASKLSLARQLIADIATRTGATGRFYGKNRLKSLKNRKNTTLGVPSRQTCAYFASVWYT